MKEVLVTRKGQTTIPAELRKKYGICEGTRSEVEDTDRGIPLRPSASTAELAGTGAKYATPQGMKRMLDKLRAEDVTSTYDTRFLVEHYYFKEPSIQTKTKEAIRSYRIRYTSAIIISEVYKLTLEKESR